jgi:hypothetical protein
MRALISLYHQSKVFAKDFYSNGASFATYRDLAETMQDRRSAPVLGNPQNKEQVEPQNWSMGPAARREQMVIDALYGVDEDMPGLEALLDEENKIREAVKEDAATKSENSS